MVDTQDFGDKWDLVKLGSLTSKVGSGVTPKGGRDVYVNEGVPLIRSQNVLVGELDLSDVVYISDEQHQKMSATKLEPLDVLLNITGASIGRCAIVPNDLGEGNVNQHVCIIRTMSNLSPSYLMQFLNSDAGQDQIWSFQAGGNRQGLNFEQIRAFTIPLPPLAEQRQIAAILSTWDEAITLTTRLIAALQRRKQALMQLLLTGAVRFPGFEDNEWEEVTLLEVSAKLESGGTPSTQIDAYWNGEIPWITGADFGDLTISQIRRYITEEAVSNSSTKVAKAGDILLVSRTGVGKIAIAPFDIAISQDITRLVPKPDLANTSYLLYYLAHTTLQLARFNQGTSINGVTRDDLKNHLVQLPSIEEQAQIAAFLDVCNKQISDLQATVIQLQTQKRGLMQQLLTGAVRVPLANP